MATNDTEGILHKELSYKLQGLFFDIRNDMGSGHKESIYQKALEKRLVGASIKHKREPAIKIYSSQKEFLGLYRPDFLIDDKIIIELKAVNFVSRQEVARVYDYLKNSEYELAYLVNFASPNLYARRVIFTNDRKDKLSNMRTVAKSLLFVAISLLFVAISGLKAEAARFVVEQPVDEKAVPYTTNIYFEPEGESVNALSGEMYLPVGVKPDARTGDSIILLWVETPVYDASKNTLSFSGAIPNGYPGDKGLVMRLVFDEFVSAKKIGLSGTAYLNDGQGTLIKLKPAKFEKADNVSFTPISDDHEQPESFSPFVERNPVFFDGLAVALFMTQDKLSGIDHYEAALARPRFLGLFPPNEKKLFWQRADSPYVLPDQSGQSFIFIKAVDRNGNERVAKISPESGPSAYLNFLRFSIIVLILLAVFVSARRMRV